MIIGFAGTPAFAQRALQRIIAQHFDVRVVLTQPDRPAGRGMKLTASPVKETALSHHIPVLQPCGLKLDGRFAEQAKATEQALRSLNLDVLVVAAYGLILPAWLLTLPRLGCLNIHASLLPRWRGAAPIHRAIEAGDAITGVTIMQMDEGLDTGDMLLTEEVSIDPIDTTASLHDKLAECGAALIVTALDRLQHGGLEPRPQPSEGATYANKILKSEGALDIHMSANDLSRKVRAFNPFPGATVSLAGLSEPIKVWHAIALGNESSLPPGSIIKADTQGIDLATGQGVLRLIEVQKPGGKRQSAATFAQSHLKVS